MVIFFISLIFIIVALILTLISFSKIKLKLIDFQINDYENLKTIIKLIKDKNYVKIFDYTDFILKLELHLLNKFPLFNFKITDDGIEKFLRKQIRKNKLKREEKDLKKFDEENKKEIDNDLIDISIEKLDLLMNLGTDNASLTAFCTTALNIFISIVLLFFAESTKPENYNYDVNPLYLDEQVFNINASLVLSMPAFDLVKLIR